MKSKILLLATFMILVSMMVFSSAEGSESEIMKVKVNFLKPTVGISVPDLVLFGDIAPGYLSERRDLDIVNLGNVDVRVTPELEDYDGDIFTNLAFKEVLDDPLIKIGNYYLDLPRPTEIGGTRMESVYMYLDLTRFDGNCSEDIIGHEANVTFFALSI